jgi:hypothetical protein
MICSQPQLASQVSAFGSDSETDGGDIWSIEWDGKHKSWRQDTKVCNLLWCPLLEVRRNAAYCWNNVSEQPVIILQPSGLHALTS